MARPSPRGSIGTTRLPGGRRVRFGIVAQTPDEPMRLTVVFSNWGGPLDTRPATSPTDAVRVVRSMLEDAGELHEGDSITIRATQEREV